MYNRKINMSKFVDNAAPAETETNDCFTICVCLLRAFLLHTSRELFPPATYLTFFTSKLKFYGLYSSGSMRTIKNRVLQCLRRMCVTICESKWENSFVSNTKKHFLLKFSSPSAINNKFLSTSRKIFSRLLTFLKFNTCAKLPGRKNKKKCYKSK